ncbi:Fungal pheromone mating factor STE2 GPCR [Nakaseomyces glabratus]|nr:Fungal pheromone mating factor STE2 GPCR [Nakaseomyces glabratus]
MEMGYDPRMYNPRNEYLNFTSVYDVNDTIRFSTLDAIVKGLLRIAIVHGVRLGAIFMTLIIMFISSNTWKKPIFIINMVSLMLVMIHSALSFHYLLSNYSSISYILTGFPQLITSNNKRIQDAASIVQVLLVAAIEASLVFQIHVMFTIENIKLIREIVLSISIAMGLATVATYLAAAIKLIRGLHDEVMPQTHLIFNLSIILLASSINFMTFILVIKLFFAIRSRRYLSLRQFDAFHILLIMFCQSLLIPSVLYIIVYAVDSRSNQDYLIPIANLFVVLSLPLSSIWANTSNNSSRSPKYWKNSQTNKSNGSFVSSISVNSDSQNPLYKKIVRFTSKGDTTRSIVSDSTLAEVGKYSMQDVSNSNFECRDLDFEKVKHTCENFGRISETYSELSTLDTTALNETRLFWKQQSQCDK